MGRAYPYLILLDEGIGGKGGRYFSVARKVFGHTVRQYADLGIAGGTRNGIVREVISQVAADHPSINVIFLTSDRSIPAQQPAGITYTLVVLDTNSSSSAEFRAHLKAFKSFALAGNPRLENGMYWQATRRSDDERMSPNHRFCQRLPDVDFPTRSKHERLMRQALPSAKEILGSLDAMPVEVGRNKAVPASPPPPDSAGIRG